MENIWQSLVITVIGMSVVFSVLIILAGVIFIMRYVDEYLNNRRIAKYSKKLDRHEVEDEETNDEVVAILAAAAHIMTQKRVVIRKLRFLGQADSSWSALGRQAAMSTHNVQRKR